RQTYSLHEGPATAVAFAPDGMTFVSVGEDGAVWRIDPTARRAPVKLAQEKRPLRQIRFLPDGRTVAVTGGRVTAGHGDGAVRLFGVEDGRPCGELLTGLASSSSLSVSRDGRWLSVLGQTEERTTVVQVWDLGSRHLAQVVRAENAVGAQLFANGARLVVLVETPKGEDKAGFLTFDLSDGRRLQRVSLLGLGPRFAIFPRDESMAFAGGLYQCLSFYPVSRAGTFSHSSTTLHGHAGAILAATLSADEKMIATASEDETVRVWDRETQTELLVLRGAPSPMTDIAFSPAGGWLAAAQANGMIQVWDGSPKHSTSRP
ncbi:MAG: WD40 repeat domain-containing protein, partial [Gemmataceae bacterium]